MTLTEFIEQERAMLARMTPGPWAATEMRKGDKYCWLVDALAQYICGTSGRLQPNDADGIAQMRNHYGRMLDALEAAHNHLEKYTMHTAHAVDVSLAALLEGK